MDLQKKLKELEEQLELSKQNFHRVSGAIILVNEIIAEEKKKETDAKDEKPN